MTNGAVIPAFAEHGIAVPFERVRRALGMGGDKLMPVVAGIREESKGSDIVSAAVKRVARLQHGEQRFLQ
jgi:hypothetical protein